MNNYRLMALWGSDVVALTEEVTELERLVASAAAAQRQLRALEDDIAEYVRACAGTPHTAGRLTDARRSGRRRRTTIQHAGTSGKLDRGVAHRRRAVRLDVPGDAGVGDTLRGQAALVAPRVRPHMTHSAPASNPAAWWWWWGEEVKARC